MSETSIYETSFAQRPRYPRPDQVPQTDIAIIGGGLTGISAALTLAEAGRRVTVLEAGRVGAGGSGRNGGHLCQGWSSDFAKISRQLSSRGCRYRLADRHGGSRSRHLANRGVRH